MQQTQVARETLTWENFGTGSRDLAQMVADSGFRPTSSWPSLVAGFRRPGRLPTH
jgi:hypothetical protein